MDLILHCYIEGSIPILLRTIERNLYHRAFSSVFHFRRLLQGKNKAPQITRRKKWARMHRKITNIKGRCYWPRNGVPATRRNKDTFLEEWHLVGFSTVQSPRKGATIQSNWFLQKQGIKGSFWFHDQITPKY